jgi:hypothetical protein
MTMSSYEHAIRRYEHRRWTTDDNRMVRAFEWGLEHLGGPADHPDPRLFLAEYSSEAIASSSRWFAPGDVSDYHLDSDNILTFTSPLTSPWPENNTVHAQFFPARKSGPAVLVLPNWNAKWHGQVALCHWLKRVGITAIKLSLPYHDRRMAMGHERADQLVGPNVGLTLAANRQAVQDARSCLTWLEHHGYDRLGILGHDPRVRAGGFFHVSTYFADVVSQGMTTNHVWEALRHEVTVDELRRYWAPISPMPYVERGMGARRETFMVYGKYDPTFLHELTLQMLDSLRRHGADPGTLELPVGHYSLELPPFSYIAGYRMLMFFLEALG